MFRARWRRSRSSDPMFAPKSTARSTSSSRAPATPWSSRRSAIRSSPTTAIFRRRKDASAGRIWLLTGPNMAGKSTFLRQNALIVVLAQMGGFVPAKRAKIGVVDRLFSRVGAADDLARGRSTFMVEMVETAAILNQACERSLVILDEIGRGTATFDGLSIAWAAIEHLHETEPLPRAVRDAFPRADGARDQACPPAQRHRSRQGMAGRGGVPARSNPRCGGPLLRNPGGEARRPPRERDRARQGGAGDARGRRSRRRRAASRTCRCLRRRPARPRPTRARPRSRLWSPTSTPSTPTSFRPGRRSRRCMR